MTRKYKLAHHGDSITLTAATGPGVAAIKLRASGPKRFRVVEVSDELAEKFGDGLAELVGRGHLIPVP